MVEIPDPVVGTLLSNTMEREVPALAAATLALVLAKGSVTVTSKALSVMLAPDEDISSCSAGKITPLLQTDCDGKRALFRLFLLASILFFVSASRHLGGSVIREH